jgi:hypothetical protein
VFKIKLTIKEFHERRGILDAAALSTGAEYSGAGYGGGEFLPRISRMTRMPRAEGGFPRTGQSDHQM